MLSSLLKPMCNEEEDDLIKDLIPWYLTSEQENVALLEMALAKRDFAFLIEIGDKMYGHGKTYGFQLISTLGKRIEAAAMAQDTYQLASLISSLKSYIEKCINDVKNISFWEYTIVFGNGV